MTEMRPDGGFTLLEVLVALAILGLSLSVIYQVISTGLHNDARAERHWAAAALAEGRMALIGTEVPPQEGRWSGETPDGFEWTVLVVPVADEPVLQANDSLRLLDVTVTVNWSDRYRERELTLRSFRLGQAPMAAP